MGALDDGERVVVADAVAWRAWLVENHTTSTGAWLVRASRVRRHRRRL